MLLILSVFASGYQTTNAVMTAPPSATHSSTSIDKANQNLTPGFPDNGPNPGLPNNEINPSTLNITVIIWGILGTIIVLLLIILFFARRKKQ